MTNNTFGPSHKIKESESASETALTSRYVFFDQQVFNDFKKRCQENKDKLKTNKFITKSLTEEDIEKFDETYIPDDLVMKIFIAINHTAGYNENGHIGLKIAEEFGKELGEELGNEFALQWFKLRATSAHIESCKDAETTISISNFANIDGNIFGKERSNFRDSLAERKAVVLAQLQSALSKISTLKEDNEIKKSIQNFINQIESTIENKKYPQKPDDKQKQIQQATQAITYANLINAMHSVPEDSVMLYSKPNLFLPNKNDREKCKPENFNQMVKDVVNATERPIIIDKKLYQKDKETEQLTTEEINLTNKECIKLIAEKLGEKLLGKKLTIGINGAVHQMAPGKIINWQPSIGRNFIEIEGKRLALEESMRELFNELRLRNQCVGQDVKITAELPDGQERQIGFAVYGDRTEKTISRETSSSASTPAAIPPQATMQTSDKEPSIEEVSAPPSTTCCLFQWLCFFNPFKQSRS